MIGKNVLTSNIVKDHKAGRSSVLMTKLCALLSKILLAIPAMLCVLVIRMLRPFVVIRFGGLDISRIGGIYKADWYLSECSAGMHGKKYFDIFYFITDNKIICNQQWLKMWKRALHVFSFWRLAGMVDKIFKTISNDGYHSVPMNYVIPLHDEPIDKYNDKLKIILAHKKPHISFTGAEEALGQKALREMGVPEGKAFVCFHARDSAYLDSLHPERSWDYHDYRDSHIANYLLSMEELTRRGYYAIRVGAVVQEKLATTNPAIIDYSSNGKRSEFLDIYLGARCKSFLCSDAGISIIPEVFRRPVVYVNWTSIRQISPWILNGLFIFKKFYLRKENRFLTFHEIINLQFGGVDTKDIFSRKGLELIENTPEEISGVVDEVEQRLKGTWETTPEDERLQECFWALFGPGKLKTPEVRIGAEFLRQNQQLLIPNSSPVEAEIGFI